ncbi:hypothetical protein AVEN_246626-1 [Araneus ventricosus]|uniref:Uncharacterized protein n=1 Tax=Araneus ventricosus TaxID=182803 RepID=A0A4Y2PDT1_ARAVE|nr:hypothetical protein AVEN_246626-1 [Araneus ventricosus]
MCCDYEWPVVNHMTDIGIKMADLKSGHNENECDSDSEEEASTDEKSVALDNKLKNMNSVIKGLEERNIVSKHDLRLLYKVKEKNCNHKMKSMQQLSILDMFKK